MLFQAPPIAPPPTPPAAEQRVIRQDASANIAATLDRRLTLQKPPVSEAVMVRQRIIVRASLTHYAVSQPDGRERGDCRWEIVSYIQRDFCFTSISGLTGCTATVNDKLAQEAGGVLDVPVDPPADPPPGPEKACAFTSGVLSAALADAAARLEDRSAKIFESDFATHVRPLLTRNGATVKPR